MISFNTDLLVQRFVIAAIFLTGFTLGAAVVYLLAVPDLGETTVTTETTSDTTLVRKDTSIRNKITPEHLMKTVASETFDARFDSVREYTGTNTMPHGSITWRAKTGGILQDLDIDTELYMPVVTTTTKETVTREVHRPSLYVTGTYEGDKSISPGIMYSRKKWVAGYKYKISGQDPNQRHSFTVGFRLR